MPGCVLLEHSVTVYTVTTQDIISPGMFDLDYCAKYYLQNNRKGVVH